MAKFEIAEGITGKNEGLYANNPDDTGLETYAGISRKFWPQWSGWETIDAIKKQYGTNPHTINQWASQSEELLQNISDFYKANFWDVNKLDYFDDQQLANSVYDFGVNSGTKKAAKVLQECLNIPVDGMVGQQTLNAVNASNAAELLTDYNAKRKAFYESLASNPTQHQFLASWLSRLKTYQS